MNKLSRQEMFNKAYNGVIEQGCQAYNHEMSQCVYRNGNQRCAVGHIMKGCIPEDSNLWAHDGTVKDVLDVADAVGQELPFDWDDEKFLHEMQRVHDNLVDDEDFVDNFKNRMSNFARKYDLVCPE